ncbi:MAG TPA: carbon-nitrogen hydrolase family protein [Candidatus Dormibacteraeota bacterium]|nr:carbon-nitrogen hydrolase family protein [Candidatus Dormibacteraeota bacterium]
MAERKVRVAIAQAAPVFLDLDRSVEKAVRLIEEAARKGARLVAFGESWLPGYPAWLDLCPGAAFWDHPPAKRAYARLVENSAVIPGPVTDRLGAAAREQGVVVVIGVHERVVSGPGHGTLYNTNLVVGSDGTLLSRHRKLVPTHAERLVWGQGDGSGLEAVATSAGRVGTLICWEHWMPLARQAMHESAEEIHVANWPTVRDMYQVASRHYAFEGRCFVLAAGLITEARDLPADLELPPEMKGKPDTLVCAGGSCIIGPDGALVAGPVFDREEILVADLDLGTIPGESMALDVTGHYNRPDVFQFTKRVVI